MSPRGKSLIRVFGRHRENGIQFTQVSGMMGRGRTEAAHGLQVVHEEVMLHYRRTYYDCVWRSFLRNAGGAAGIPPRNCILFPQSACDICLIFRCRTRWRHRGLREKCLFVSNTTWGGADNLLQWLHYVVWKRRSLYKATHAGRVKCTLDVQRPVICRSYFRFNRSNVELKSICYFRVFCGGSSWTHVSYCLL